MSNHTLLAEAIAKGIDYSTYLEMSHALYEAKKSSPADTAQASEDMLNYVKMNLQRMERVAKTMDLSPETIATAQALGQKIYFLAISEVWCGDAAQNMPLIAKIADANPEKISLKIVWRDLNPDLMNAYLTNGGKAIPKIVVLDENLNELATWGARPTAALPIVAEWKASGAAHSVLVETIQRWYNKDKGQSLQDDFNKILTAINNKK